MSLTQSQECDKNGREASGLKRETQKRYSGGIGQISLRKEQADPAGRKEQANVNPSMYPQSTVDTQPSLPISHDQAIEALRSRCSRGSNSPYDRSDRPTVAMPCAMFFGQRYRSAMTSGYGAHLERWGLTPHSSSGEVHLKGQLAAIGKLLRYL